MIFIAGISIAVFFELLLIFKKNKSQSDKILIIWMFLISFHMFLFFMDYTVENYNYPFILGWILPLPLIHGVMLYLYVASSTNQLPKNRKILGLHFIPVAAAYAYLVPYFLLPAEEKIHIYRNNGLGYAVFMKFLFVAYMITGIGYQIWSVVLLQRHRKNIVNQFSDIEKRDLNWLRILVWGMAAIWLVVLLDVNDFYDFLTVNFFVFVMGFFGIKQIAVYPEKQTVKVEDKEKKKYLKSGLKKDVSEELYQKLTQLMEQKKLYTKNDLLINDLATEFDVHPNYLSQVINEKEGRNFYEFVNHYRLEEFKRLIAIPKNRQLTLLSLAFECGFNSKSSFNRYFKKSTGQTPSQYFSLITSK
jgi:AraC-like DNA-binding protein